ncbi:TylF/MycF/NovP-related O-methyltransferase [Mycobacterium sp.]|uniref:TylF/MycF/NovP-related O-methyltransferase n=1 Tax=Mycobacterium sp. TaxID=1785 RepID=UPI0011FEB3C3|nr:TylF/MycF/NovP-related O-methyltransferase [Mycobacterium sp.]TAM65977.1 MAG: macrocin O-methyltransferase [Mycobacterium sp.]
MLSQLRETIRSRLSWASAGSALPTYGQQVSLPQRDFPTCKPAYSKKRLQKQFHELKDDTFWQIVPEVHDFTQLPIEPMWSLYEAVRYLAAREIKGDIVECGVLFGGASMLIAKTLLSVGDTSRELWLYDSFRGFVGEQADDDITWYGDSIKDRYPDFGDIAQNNIASTGYPLDKLRLVEGDVEKTAANNENGDIALLRLDTDTYHSTKAELEYFYPKLVTGGILIIDDYGHAFGARRAVDEYFADPARRLLLKRVNFTNRLAVKV